MANIIRTKENVYEKIANKYKTLIINDVLTEGMALPSCRDVALDLGVNPNTVSRAFQLLEEEGYIEILPKKGAFVKRRDVTHQDDLEQIRNFLSLNKNNVSKNELIKIISELYEERDEK